MKWREKAADLGGIPEDVLMGWPKAILYGRRRLIVEQHQGILTYQENIIRLKTSCGVLSVAGAGLQITHYGPMDAVVTGEILSVSYDFGAKEGKKP
jgi:sporulation protein YqfC